MPNKYKRCDVALFIGRAMLGMRKMRIELNEHRYFLERSVERETAHLSKRIALLESCNATLSGKLALAYQEVATLKQQSPHDLPRPYGLHGKDAKQNEGGAKLRVMNNQAQKPVGANAQETWGERAVAA